MTYPSKRRILVFVAIVPGLPDAIRYFADPVRCRELMLLLRWPDGCVRCPVCGASRLSFLARGGVWKCYGEHPRPRFSLKSGSLFEDSALPLEKWFPAVWMLVNRGDRVSSWQLHRALGVTQKTAWFMLHRVRLALLAEPLSWPDSGFACREADREPSGRPVLSAAAFENTPEFHRFRREMKQLLRVPKAALVRRMEMAQDVSRRRKPAG